MRKLRKTIYLQKEIDEWISKHGACKINMKEEEIDLFNGGLFQDMDENKANLWIGDLDSTIRYLIRLQYFLKQKGFDTGRGL